MKAGQYFQICRALMPLAAASALAACEIDLQSYGEPLFDLARDASVHDAAADQPSDSAGSSAEPQNAADGGTTMRDGAVDASDAEDAGMDEDAPT
jgi:hypothetical protein